MILNKAIFILLLMLSIYKDVKAQYAYEWQVVFTNCTPEFTKDTIAPSFPGGDNALYKLLQKEVGYPQIALENGIEGYVVIQFIVNTDGTISEIKTLKDNGGKFC
jgi:hypothetical protein